MNNDFIKVTTFSQVKFHILKGEIIIFNLKDGVGYIKKNNNEVEIIIQPKYGSAIVSSGDYNKLETLINNLNSDLYLYKGVKLISKPTTFLDKFSDFLKDNLS